METQPRLRYSCKFPYCRNSYYTNIPRNSTHQNKRFYRFPKDIETFNKWKEICNITSITKCKNFFICEDHFLPQDFVNESKHRLNYKAVPFYIISCDDTTNHSRIEKKTMPSSVINCEDISDDATSTAKIDLPTTSRDCVIQEDGVTTIDSLMVLKRTYSECLEVQENENYTSTSRFSFLNEEVLERGGILSKINTPANELSPRKHKMYRIHRNMCSRICKLKKTLQEEKNKLKLIQNLYNEGKFQFITEKLNSVTKQFITSQLQNASRNMKGRRWTAEDKAFALSLYKRSPKLYRYLEHCFAMPSIRTLKNILSQIPFDTGINKPIMQHLQSEVSKMDNINKYVTLSWDEMTIAKGFIYEQSKQVAFGYEDLGHLGRTNKDARKALVFMIRRVGKRFKQIIAYYFTATTNPAIILKQLIVKTILAVQEIGLHVVATVCDQASTNVAALSFLCRENTCNASSYHFMVNNECIFTIFDVPHLLKCTRNCLIRCKIEYDTNKFAKMEHVELAFKKDQETRTFKQLNKLQKRHFNFQDTFMKMRVNIAAWQLSASVASSIETFIACGELPQEAFATAEFAELIDHLFDSLNGHTLYPQNGKKYRCVVTHTSPHLEFWMDSIAKLRKWKLIDMKTGKNVTSEYRFVEGWIISLRAVRGLWLHLKQVGFSYLSLRALNQDHVENLFSKIRQHGISNTNPNAYQFIAALKTVVVNSIAMPLSNNCNCEDDDCLSLSHLSQFLNSNCCSNTADDERTSLENCEELDCHFEDLKENVSSAYVAGYIISKINVPDCEMCRNYVYSESVTEKHLFITFKEFSDEKRLKYANDNIINLMQVIHTYLYEFLNQHGFAKNLENTFKEKHSKQLQMFKICTVHTTLVDDIITKTIKLTIYKFFKEKSTTTVFDRSSSNKMKRFKTG